MKKTEGWSGWSLFVSKVIGSGWKDKKIEAEFLEQVPKKDYVGTPKEQLLKYLKTLA